MEALFIDIVQGATSWAAWAIRASASITQSPILWTTWAIAAFASWLLLRHALSVVKTWRKPGKPHNPRTSRAPIPISRKSLTEFLTSNPVALELQAELAQLFGVPLVADLTNLAWAEEQALALGVGDLATLDQL